MSPTSTAAERDHERADRGLSCSARRSGGSVRVDGRRPGAGKVDLRNDHVRRRECGIPAQVGSRIAAFTGFWSIGFLDTMTVTEYDPPRRWVMDKDGALLHGVGIMQVEPLPQGCRVSWVNELDLPFGILGRLGWPIARPLARLALTAALKRMGRLIDKGVLPLAPAPARQIDPSSGSHALTS